MSQESILEKYITPCDQKLGDIIEKLNELASRLEVQDVSVSSLSAAIDKLTADEIALSERLVRLRQAEEEMRRHLAALKHEHSLLIKWNHDIVPGPSNQLGLETAAVLERRREVTVKKAKDAHTELQTLKSADPLQPKVTLTDFIAQRTKNEALEKELMEKTARVEAFQGLPANLDLARHELRVAKEEYRQLAQRRQELLNKMSEGMA